MTRVSAVHPTRAGRAGCVVVGLILGVTATKPVAIGACELGCRGSIG